MQIMLFYLRQFALLHVLPRGLPAQPRVLELAAVASKVKRLLYCGQLDHVIQPTAAVQTWIEFDVIWVIVEDDLYQLV